MRLFIVFTFTTLFFSAAISEACKPCDRYPYSIRNSQLVFLASLSEKIKPLSKAEKKRLKVTINDKANPVSRNLHFNVSKVLKGAHSKKNLTVSTSGGTSWCYPGIYLPEYGKQYVIFARNTNYSETHDKNPNYIIGGYCHVGGVEVINGTLEWNRQKISLEELRSKLKK